MSNYPPLTAEEFATGCADPSAPIPVCEDENGYNVFMMGHHDPISVMKAVQKYDEDMTGETFELGEGYSLPEQVWAITEQPADGPDGWAVRWGGISADTPGAFPMTVVSR